MRVPVPAKENGKDKDVMWMVSVAATSASTTVPVVMVPANAWTGSPEAFVNSMCSVAPWLHHVQETVVNVVWVCAPAKTVSLALVAKSMSAVM